MCYSVISWCLKILKRMREHGLSGNNVKFPSGFRFWCLVLAVYVMSAGCTRNNGDIGDWFGTWQMTEISVNGVAVGNYEKNIFWQFRKRYYKFEEGKKPVKGNIAAMTVGAPGKNRATFFSLISHIPTTKIPWNQVKAVMVPMPRYVSWVSHMAKYRH